MEKQHLQYDAFIIYKRQGGLGWAELVWMTLANKHKEVFIDHFVSVGPSTLLSLNYIKR